MTVGPLAHAPVMLSEMLKTLAPVDGGVYLDGTFGGGGYARAILDAAHCTLIALDRDPDAIARGADLVSRYPGRLRLVEGRFGSMLSMLSESGVDALDGVVLDLGVSSFQLDDAGRGFSFRFDGPLDMRMGRVGRSAADIVRTAGETELADILFQYGEERLSRRIARAIVTARAAAPITSTAQLAEIIRRAVPPERPRSGAPRIDPATRGFQALRIVVNDELGEIERGLAEAASVLGAGGRLVVISFHSLEDRIVKRFMEDAAGLAPAPSRHDPGGLAPRRAPGFRLVARGVVRPGDAEVSANPRARSARMRAIERLGTRRTSGQGLES